MTWLLAGLAGLAGLFYGMWMRTKYVNAREEVTRLKVVVYDMNIKITEGVIRREQIIEDLKDRLLRANQKLIGGADAGTILDILNGMYSQDPHG